MAKLVVVGAAGVGERINDRSLGCHEADSEGQRGEEREKDLHFDWVVGGCKWNP